MGCVCVCARDNCVCVCVCIQWACVHYLLRMSVYIKRACADFLFCARVCVCVCVYMKWVCAEKKAKKKSKRERNFPRDAID